MKAASPKSTTTELRRESLAFKNVAFKKGREGPRGSGQMAGVVINEAITRGGQVRTRLQTETRAKSDTFADRFTAMAFEVSSYISEKFRR